MNVSFRPSFTTTPNIEITQPIFQKVMCDINFQKIICDSCNTQPAASNSIRYKVHFCPNDKRLRFWMNEGVVPGPLQLRMDAAYKNIHNNLQCPFAHLDVGYVLVDVGIYDKDIIGIMTKKAEEFFRFAFHLDPNMIFQIFHKIEILLDRGLLQEAAIIFAIAGKIDPASCKKFGVKLLDIEILQELNYEEIFFNNVMKVNPNDAHSLFLLGVAQNQRCKFDQSIQTLIKSIELCPSKEAYELLIGLYELYLKNSDLAVNACRGLLELNLNDDQVLADLARLLMLSGNLPEAIEKANEALRINEQNDRACVVLGTIYTESAIKFFEEKNSARLDMEFDSAIYYLKLAININPENRSAHLLLMQLDALQQSINQ